MQRAPCKPADRTHAPLDCPCCPLEFNTSLGNIPTQCIHRRRRQMRMRPSNCGVITTDTSNTPKNRTVATHRSVRLYADSTFANQPMISYVRAFSGMYTRPAGNATLYLQIFANRDALHVRFEQFCNFSVMHNAYETKGKCDCIMKSEECRFRCMRLWLYFCAYAQQPPYAIQRKQRSSQIT